jgi:hypothetical protein
MGWRRVSKYNWQWVLIVGAATASPACEVDNRQLSGVRLAADMGGAGCGSGAVQDCNSSDGGDSGTVGGSSGNAATCANRICPDLNNNNVPDDTETLALNPTFEGDINDWDPETGVGLGWNNIDACGRCDSGSISVTNQFAGTASPYALVGARQCISAIPGRLYEIMGRANPSADSFAGVGLEFYASADCKGNKITSFNSSLVMTESIWQKATARGTAPDSAQSAALRLYVAASAPPPAGLYSNVLFDNILVLTL